MVRRFHIPPTGTNIAAVAAAALLLGIGEFKTELATSQTDTLVLLGFVLALVWLDRRPLLCGLALGFSCNIKYQTLIALPYLIITRRWKAAAATAISSVAFALLPALLVGFGRSRISQGSVRGPWAFRKRKHARRRRNGLANLDPKRFSHERNWTRARSLRLEPQPRVSVCPLVALACLALAWMLYRTRGISMFQAGYSILPGADRFEGLVAIEWTGLMVVWLVFGPEVSRRHMYVLLLMHMIAVAVLFECRGGNGSCLSAASLFPRQACGCRPAPVRIRLPLCLTGPEAPVGRCWHIMAPSFPPASHGFKNLRVLPSLNPGPEPAQFTRSRSAAAREGATPPGQLAGAVSGIAESNVTSLVSLLPNELESKIERQSTRTCGNATGRGPAGES